MGVIVQPLLISRKTEKKGAPAISQSMDRLFTEFLVRYREWQSYQKRELGWLLATMTLGLTSLAFWMYFSFAWGMNIALLLLFIGILRRYLNVRNQVNHLYINVHILHHHLLGKLDVGFCNHLGECQCSEQFKKYVWDHYRISLYGDQV